MKIQNQHYRSIWLNPNNHQQVQIIDQRFLPHQLEIKTLTCWQDCATAIEEMWIRGAPLIGATAAFGMYLAALQLPAQQPEAYLQQVAQNLLATRPTAVNLRWAVERQLHTLAGLPPNSPNIAQTLLNTANTIANEDVETCRMIGVHGLQLLKDIYARKTTAGPLNILTHCNAGWLACVDWGTATSPIYLAVRAGIPVHVWVSETRPRNQGANLTAWELEQNGIAHTVVVDNCCGHLLQHGMVDICIVGTDRTTRTGDVANKTGTYLKALAAHDNGIPFYVALPSSTIDWQISNGLKEITIEQRHPDEVKYVGGISNGQYHRVLITPPNSQAVNYGFDVTPARLITGLITERGICPASEQGLLQLFPDMYFPD
ncbi:S-methyl-5-thioribose-1-phosphate isomerase [Sphingobacteriales bacterium UPWRP_1]|nr:S-methyl-5-thioribose-1-phosphate isomerase [Sphingobacteriales bacterium TSM_CSS]PSJ78359.1 S-methyl-5-thioribose-1-phosphate isomerase [Sphingobacteriales bacterium UPWRP_1]